MKLTDKDYKIAVGGGVYNSGVETLPSMLKTLLHSVPRNVEYLLITGVGHRVSVKSTHV